MDDIAYDTDTLEEARTVVAGEAERMPVLADRWAASPPPDLGALDAARAVIDALAALTRALVADLDAGIQRSIDAYTDPWGQDAKEPATPGQFRPSLPLIALPKVPVR